MRKFSMIVLAGVATVAMAGTSSAQLSAVAPSVGANKLAAQAGEAVVQKPAEMGALAKASNASSAMAMTQSVGSSAPTSKLGSAAVSGASHDSRLSTLARPGATAAQLSTLGATRDMSAALGRSPAASNMLEVGKGAASTQARQ